MRVAVAVRKFPMLSETFVVDQITGLIDRGHDVKIMSLGEGDWNSAHPSVEKYGLRKKTKAKPPQVYSGRAGRWSNAAWLLTILMVRNPVGTVHLLVRLPALLREHGWDEFYMAILALWWPNIKVIHCHFGWTAQEFVALKQARIVRCPLVTTFHGTDVNVVGKASGPDFCKKLSDSLDCVTVGSTFMQQQLTAIRVDTNKIVKIPLGIDLTRFTFQQRNFSGEKSVRLLTVGRLVEVKGVEYAIRAISLLKARGIQVSCDIVGDGPLRDSLNDLVAELEVQQEVRFLGPLPQAELPQIYLERDLFLMPGIVASDGSVEGQGIVLLEAQASGLPVVAASVGGIPESVDAGKSAILVPQKDPQALADAIESLINDPERYSAMSQAGPRFVQQQFDLDRSNDRISELLQSVVSDA